MYNQEQKLLRLRKIVGKTDPYVLLKYGCYKFNWDNYNFTLNVERFLGEWYIIIRHCHTIIRVQKLKQEVTVYKGSVIIKWKKDTIVK